MFALSASFAADENVTLSEVDDEIIVDDVLSVEEDDDTLSVDDENSNVLGSNVVTNSTFHDYFDDGGNLFGNVTADELEFEGDFTGIDVEYINIAKSIKFIGNNATFDGVTFVVLADNVVIDGFKLVSKDDDVTLIGINEVKNVTISNNIIDFKGINGFDGIAIYAVDVDTLRIINNTITYVGNSTGEEINNVIRVTYQDKRSKNILVENNTLDITMPSVNVGYDEDWNSKAFTDGVVFYGCDDVVFKDNDITLNYNKAIGSYDTIHALTIGNSNFDYEEGGFSNVCKNVLVSDNTITAKGHTYLYGIYIVADKFNITDNKIDVSSDAHYAAAFSIDGPSSDGYIANNDVTVEAPNLVLGVYAYSMMASIDDLVFNNNTITADAYAVCGMEIISNGVTISENTMILNGNYTTGIVGDMGLAYIENNDIKSLGSNVGNASTGDSYIHKVSTGICVNDDNFISGNTIVSTGIGIDLNDYGSGGMIVVSENTIEVIATGSASNFAIYVNGMDNVWIYQNNITFAGLTDGYSIVTNAMYVADTDARIYNNTFDIKLPSVDVAWFEIPPGSNNWVSEPISEGIVIDSCDDVIFEENIINLEYSTVSTFSGYDTIYVVDVKDSRNAAVRKNMINGVGNDYIYGIIISGENFNISGNVIQIISNYYANGIDIEGPASGVVENNNIAVKASNSVYAIYSGMNGKEANVNYTENTILGNAYNAFAFSLGDVESNIVKNKVGLNGNYTTGIAFKGGKVNAENNTLILLSSEIGDMYVWEADFGVESVGVKIIKGNATLTENRIGSYGKAIYIGSNAGLVDIDENEIAVLAHEDKDAYAIFAENVPNLEIHDNDIRYRGATKGIGINNAVYLYNATSAKIYDNEFELELVSCEVPWKEIPAGSYNWVSFPVSEGIVVENSNGVVFDNNYVAVYYNNISGSYDTIYSVSFKNSDDALITNNDINSYGFSYIYGIYMSGEDFIIRSNDISSFSNYYANGIDIEGPASGVVESNYIEVEADNSVYAIYSGMNGQNVSVEYYKNEIYGYSYNVFGFSLGDVESDIVDNTILLEGNYTTGIAFKGKTINIEDNSIKLASDEIGDMYVWEANFGVETVGIKLIEGDATVIGNIISTSGKGIYVADVNSADIGDNFIEVVANVDKDAYAIYAEDVPGLLVYQNYITYTGATAGNGINNAVYLYNATSAIIVDNEFDLELVSCEVPWKEIPAGSGNWVSFSVSEGIVVVDSDDVTFYKNVVDVEYNEVYGAFDTIYTVDFITSSNAVISENNITANGHSYVYGIIITSENFTICDNRILVLSDNNYANGINPDADASGIVENNTIVAVGKEFSYPIYSNMYGDVTNFNVDYIGNEIYGYARNVVGLDLNGGIENIINNTIIAEGGYTCAIKAGSLNNTISDNIIRSLGTSSEDNTAITVSKGVANISDNYIESIAGEYAIDLGNTNSTVDDNYITGRKNEGRNAIANPGAGAIIKNVSPGYKTILFALDAHYVYKDGSVYSVYALDENGKPISGITIVAAYGFVNLNATTDANGLARFTSDLDAGDHNITFTFNGNDDYAPVSATGHIKVDLRSTEIVVPASTTVLLTAVKSQTSFITLTLKDSKGNLLANRYVNIVFNGKKGVYVTDKNGAIKYLLDTSKAGTQTLTMSFDGDKNYLASSATTKVKFTKEASKLTAKKKSFKAKKKTKKYTVTLKDSKNKGINKAKISLKIKGKYYDAKTNSKGKAVFKIKKLSKKGKYKAKVKYEGNSYYNAASKSVKITVK